MGTSALRKSIFLAFCLASDAARPAEPSLPEPIRTAIEDGVRAGVYHDVAIGWIDGQDRGTQLFGQAAAESRFEIGALTEVFIGVLLAQQAYEGKLRLQSTLHERLPQIAFAEATFAAATLESLATHAAPLPAVPPNLLPAGMDDPYADYGTDELRALLANYRRPAVMTASYSPLHYGVLGYALAGGGDVRAFLHEKVLAPLAMKHTDFEDAGLLEAHARGGPVTHWHFNALAASGGLRSTVGDLLDFLQSNLRPEKSPLRAALLLTRQPREAGEALGWKIKPAESGELGWPVLWRGSATAGMSAFMAFRTDTQRAVVLLGDNDSDVSAIGMAYIDGASLPVAPRRHERGAAAAAADYTGLYQVKGGREVIVREFGQCLWVQLHGEPAMRLYDDGDDTFDAGMDPLVVSFQREAHKVTSLVLSRSGVSLLALRLTERAPHLSREPIAMSDAAVEEIRGDYQLGDALLRIAKQGDAATMQLTGRAPIALQAVARDRLACVDDSCDLSVRRDEQKKISGLDVDLAGGQRHAARVNWNKP